MRYTLLALLTFTASALAQPIALFDGKTLNGWDFDPALWHVEGGMITGGSTTEKIKANDFISTTQSYADFELVLKIKVSGDPTTGMLNSGIQIRSQRTGHAMSGYQIDCGAGWFGKIYDEHRRNKVIAEPLDAAALAAKVDVFGWNEYRIRAEGPRIQTWINGVHCLDYTEKDPGIILDGQIAPQVHSGGVCLVQVKDVTLEELPAPSPLVLTVEGAALAPPGFLAKAEPTLKAWYPRIRHILGVDYETPTAVTLRFKDMPGVAHAKGAVIEASSAYFKSHPDDVGALVHELVHVIQAYPQGSPGWLVEGIADYVRYYYYEPGRGLAFKPSPLRPYTSGYDPAASLLAKVQIGKPTNLMAELNRRGHTGKLSEAAFTEVIGMTSEEAWQLTLGNKPKATAAFQNVKGEKRDTSYNAVQGSAKTAEEQQKLFHLPPGYEIELVVKESEGLGKFVSVYFDQRGRLWTQTALEYPIDANENPAAAEAVYAGKGKDKVLFYPREAVNALPVGGLTNPTIFAEGLAIPVGLLPWGNGDSAYVQHGHDLKLFKDTDGDGKADTHEVVLTGFGVQDSHLFPHQFTRAPGGWIWLAQGLFNNSKVHKPGSDKIVDWPKCSMARMRPDGSEFEVTSVGPNNIWGLVITGEGEAFIQEANDYGYPVMPFHEYAYYPGGMESLKKSYQPEMPPQTEVRMGGTGLSGLALMEDIAGPVGVQALAASSNPPPPERLKAGLQRARASSDTLIMAVANPIISKVQILEMTRNGSQWKLEQLPDLITCDDPFFRPVAMTNGPDGCIYIVDWYNKIISHNEVPRAHPDRDKTRGRIWRVKATAASGARLSEAAVRGKHEDSAKPQPAVAAKLPSAAENPSAGQGPSAAASEGRAPSRIDIPDFTKLSTEALIAMLGTQPTARAHIAWQTIVDRWNSAGDAAAFEYQSLLSALRSVTADNTAKSAMRIQSLWALGSMIDNHMALIELSKLPALMGSSVAQMRQQAVAASGRITPSGDPFTFGNGFKTVVPALIHDSSPDVRQEVIKSAGLAFGNSTVANGSDGEMTDDMSLLLSFAKPSLRGPTAASRNGKQIPVGEAYDREFERYLVRMFLERHPEVVAKFLDTPEAAKLPVEARVLASLALEPKASAARVAKLLTLLDRAPNDEELLRLAQYPTEPGCGDALKALLAKPASRVAVAETLLAQKTKLDPAKLAPFLSEAAKALLGGSEGERSLAVGLIGGFQLVALEDDLVAMAKAAKPSLAALQALRELRSIASDLFASLATSTDPMLRDAALEALAASKAPDAAQRVLVLYPTLGTSQRRSALNALSSTKAGAKTIVAALLDKTLPQADLDGPTVERLATVLGNDPALEKLQTQLGGIFHEVLLLDGSEAAFVESKLTLDGPFTVECWVRLTGNIHNNDGILGAAKQLDMNFFQGKFRVWIADQNLHDVVVAKKPMTPDLWTHIAVTRDAKGSFKIYQNGELDAVSSKTSMVKFDQCNIGWTQTGKGTEGAMTEFRVWTTERSAAEIRANFDRSLDPSAKSNPSYAIAKSRLSKGARIAKTIDTPPLLTPEQAAALDTKFAKYSALGHKPGNLENGKVLSTICMVCHQIGNAGAQIGPNLSGAGAMGLEGVLRNIMTPNAAMEAGYRIFRTELKSGDIVDAFYVSDDKDAYIVRQPGTPDRRIAKADVRSTKYIRRSLMPEGLLDGLNESQVTDLLSYLMTLK